MKNFYFLFIILFLTNCVGSDGLIVDSPPKTVFNYDYGSSVSRDFYGKVLDRAGNPVSGAVVSIGSSTTQTTDKGFFIMKNISVKEKFAHIKVKKSGFVNASRVLLPTAGNNRIDVMMIPATTTATIATGSVSTVSLTDGTKVKFNGNFKDANGNAYSGNVNVALFNLRPSDTYFNEAMPGNLVAADAEGNPRVLESYGMIHVQLTGSAGQDLQLANGQTAEITIPVDVTQTSTAPANIPLWSFDEEMGIWKLDGTATKTGNVYVGNVSHFSWWNVSYPDPLSTLTVTVTTPANQPLAGVMVSILLPPQPSNHVLATNNLGVAEGFVPANQPLVLQISDLCGNVVYSNNIGPFTPSSSNAVTATVSTASTVTVSGTLTDCSGNNVTNGVVYLSPPNYSSFFAYNMQLVNTGNFSFATVVACNTGSQFELIGYDYTNMQSTGNISFTATVPTTNVGVLTACNAVSEFITYQIDTQTPKVCAGMISGGWTTNGSSVSHQGINNFGFYYNGLLSTGLVLTSGYNLELSGALTNPSPVPIYVNGITNNITFQVNNFGAVGSYIDFTFSGTYMDTSVTPAIQRTVTGTGHVIRDY